MLRLNEILSITRLQPQPLKNTLQYCGDDNWDVITGRGLRRSSVWELVARCGRDDLASGRQGQVRRARGTLAGLEAASKVDWRRRRRRGASICSRVFVVASTLIHPFLRRTPIQIRMMIEIEICSDQNRAVGRQASCWVEAVDKQVHREALAAGNSGYAAVENRSIGNDGGSLHAVPLVPQLRNQRLQNQILPNPMVV